MLNAIDVVPLFKIVGTPVSCEPYGCGHINDTYLVTCDNGYKYILQRINNKVFPNVEGLMNNIVSVTTFLRQKTKAEGRNANRECLTPIKLLNDEWYIEEKNGFWRMFIFIDNALTLQNAEEPRDFYNAGCAFGRFQQMLADFPADSLCEVIEGFHNTKQRYENLEKAIAANQSGRADEVKAEIEFARARKEDCAVLVDMLAAGELPLRVTHNDTKLNNVLLDPVTKEPVAVIDLDTVMPGLSLYDFGDSIRFGASTGAEDEKDLSKIECDLGLFEEFTKGFLSECRSLTDNEIKMLAFSAKILTLECGMRFLADHIDGDKYFKIHREGHNLDRCRTQFKLVADMEKKMDEMNKIVAKHAGK